MCGVSHQSGLVGMMGVSMLRRIRGPDGSAESMALWPMPVCDVGHGGTVFQDTHVALTIWFLAMWLTSQKNGISALGLRRGLVLGSYKTAWRCCLSCAGPWFAPTGIDWKASSKWMKSTGVREETGSIGRRVVTKALIVVAAQEDGKGIERIRLGSIPVVTKVSLLGGAFVQTIA